MNVAYLSATIRRVAANAAIAAILVGFAPRSTEAAAPVFDARTPSPLAGVDVGLRASPAFGDLDRDGDLDMLSGEYGGAFRYYRNTGSGSPAFVEQTGAQSPANGLVAASVHSQPALVDLDGDGALDLVTGSFAGTFQYFRNVGTPLAPAFAAAPTNPFSGFDVGNSSAPTFGDLDRDGDADLVAGRLTGTFAYFENTGSATSPAFVERVGTLNPLGAATVGTNLASPALGDADGDGDLDLVSGRDQGDFRYFENTGSARRPDFSERPDAANPLRGENVGSAFAKAAVVDLDRDGDLDVVGGGDAGTFVVLDNQIGQLVVSGEIDPDSLSGFPNAEPGSDFDGDGDVGLFVTNTTVNAQVPNACDYFDNIGPATNPQFVRTALPGLTALDCIGLPAPADLDGDSDVDLFSRGGVLNFNTGTPTSPSFSPTQNYFPPIPNYVAANALFADVDGDGDFDAPVIYFNPANPSLVLSKYFENTGGPTTPAFIERTGSANPLTAFPDPLVGFMDPDQDGDLDAYSSVVGSLLPGTYWENVGSRTAPEYVSRLITSSKNPFARFAILAPDEIARNPTSLRLADLDGDGDVDGFGRIFTLLFNSDGVFLENGIVRPSPRHFGPIARPFATQNVGFIAAPAAGDLDADGDPDFLLSSSFGSGAIRYFENTGTALLSSVTERTGGANPFDGLSAGTTPMFALGDLDADGDLDLVVGSYSGQFFKYFRNTGSRTAPAFVEVVGGANPVNVVIPRGAPAIGDVDGDGDLDVVVGTAAGTFRYILNAGNAVTFDQAEQVGIFNPFDGLSIPTAFLAHPALGDVDRDGDLDLVAGDEPSGQFYYFENTGTATIPSFVARSGLENPLVGRDVGQSSTPVLVDLDADDDLDVVSGEIGGGLQQFYLPEPSLGALVTAGLSLLSRIARRRM